MLHILNLYNISVHEINVFVIVDYLNFFFLRNFFWASPPPQKKVKIHCFFKYFLIISIFYTIFKTLISFNIYQ